MKLIVALGNPGPEYEKTRHNAGFMLAERFAARHGLPAEKLKFHAGFRDGAVAGQRLALLRPMTFMNRSGLAVAEAAAFHKVAAADILVLVDDLALPAGALRLREDGGAGGHNGLKDIERVLGSQKYPRLRIGIDPKGPQNQSDYVLGRFTPEQWAKVDEALDLGVKAIEAWLGLPIAKAMTQVNGGQPG